MLAAALAVLLAGSPGREARIGLATHMQWSGEPIRLQVAALRDGGVRWIREDFTWAAIEPTEGSFDWRGPDALMAAAAAEGVDVLALLAYSAPWAASGDDEHFPPRDPADYARYARAVVERYGEGGSFWEGRDDVRPLRAVEVWNEPWGHFFWEPDPDPAAYAALARAAARAVREAGASVQVLVPADLLQVRTDGSIAPWFEALLAADPDLPELVDGWTVHPYPSPFDRSPADSDADPRFGYGRVEQVHEIARRHDVERPIWITELGWSTAPEHEESVSEEEQADYVAIALDRALGDWSDFVERIFIYSFDRSGEAADDLQAHFGLRRADGSFKPAWEEIAERAGR
ncbi:MAG: beta-galactosidase [Solirubrobacteraceae bacterium]